MVGLLAWYVNEVRRHPPREITDTRVSSEVMAMPGTRHSNLRNSGRRATLGTVLASRIGFPQLGQRRDVGLGAGASVCAWLHPTGFGVLIWIRPGTRKLKAQRSQSIRVGGPNHSVTPDLSKPSYKPTQVGPSPNKVSLGATFGIFAGWYFGCPKISGYKIFGSARKTALPDFVRRRECHFLPAAFSWGVRNFWRERAVRGMLSAIYLATGQQRHGRRSAGRRCWLQSPTYRMAPLAKDRPERAIVGRG